MLSAGFGEVFVCENARMCVKKKKNSIFFLKNLCIWFIFTIFAQFLMIVIKNLILKYIFIYGLHKE